MVIFLIAFFGIFFLSFQTVQVAFFCDNYLKEVYIKDETTQELTHIATGNPNGKWNKPNYFYDLKAAPGDLIQIICHNINFDVYGGGCFLINNNCLCYNFDSDITHNGKEYDREANLGGKQCNLKLASFIGELGDYTYRHKIPLDANGITCQNKLLFVPNGQNYQLKLSDYITADFELKNLEVKITENYEYFKLNGVQLGVNNRFKILNDLIFNSIETKKIKIKFINYGIIIEGNKECEFNIRVCHERCSDCYDKDPDENHHQCIKCKNGFYPLENTNNCLKKQEMDWSKYYFNETEQMIKRCYKNCKSNVEKNLEESVMNGDIDTSGIEEGNDEKIQLNDMSITFTTTESQKNDKNNLNKTTID